MTGLLLLFRRDWRRHPVRLVSCIVALTAGTALLVGVIAIYSSYVTSIEGVARLGGGADLDVQAATGTGVPEEVFLDVAAVEGVAAAVPLIFANVTVDGEPVLLVGIDGRVAELDQRVSAELEAVVESGADATTVFVGDGLARRLGIDVGDELAVTSATATRPARVGGVVDLDVVAGLNRGAVIVAALPTAQVLADRDRQLDHIYVIAEEGVAVDDLSAGLDAAIAGRAVVASPDLLLKQGESLIAPFQQAMLLVAAMGLLVAAFLVYNTTAITVVERRDEIAVTRALGLRRGPVMAGVLLHAATLGLVGSVAGIVLGTMFARRSIDVLPDLVVRAVGFEIGYHPTLLAPVIAVVAGVGASLVAAALPAWSAARVAPIEAFRRQGAESHADGNRALWWLAVVGASLMGAGLLLCQASDQRVGAAGIVVIGIGGVLTGRGLASQLTALACVILGWFGSVGRITAAALQRAQARVWVTMGAVATGTAVVVGVGGLTNNITEAADASFSGVADVDLIATRGLDGGLPTDLFVPPAVVDAARASAEVEAVATGRYALVDVGGEPTLFEGVHGVGASPIATGASATARAAVEAGDGVLVTRAFAQLQDHHVGDTFGLQTAGGLVELRVLEVVDVLGWPRGQVYLRQTVLEGVLGKPGSSYLNITLRPNADVAAVERSLTLAAGEADLLVSTGQEFASSVTDAVRQLYAVLGAIRWIVVIVAAVGLLNTMVISVLERTGELGLLRAMGARRRFVELSVLLEAVVMTALGGGAGVVMGVIIQLGAVASVEHASLIPLDFALQVPAVVAAVVAGIVVAAVGGAVPVWMSRRVDGLQLVLAE